MIKLVDELKIISLITSIVLFLLTVNYYYMMVWKYVRLKDGIVAHDIKFWIVILKCTVIFIHS